MKDTTGLGIGYRLLWRLEYAGLTVFGPAQVTTSRSVTRSEQSDRVPPPRVTAGQNPALPASAVAEPVEAQPASHQLTERRYFPKCGTVNATRPRSLE